jgi:DNA-binding response OmpR family regulator
MTILLLEDDPILTKEISDFLRSKHVVCDYVYDGELFLKKIRNQSYDLFLLDINVPKVNGLELCKMIREKKSDASIIMTTAYGEIEEKSEAYQSGADDYLVKPFLLEELWLRIQAIERRNNKAMIQVDTLSIGDLTIDNHQKLVMRNGKEIPLTPKEYKLLKILIDHKGMVLSKQQIADQLWDEHVETNLNTIEVYINFLRNKIDREFDQKLIHTKVGFGYYIQIAE